MLLKVALKRMFDRVVENVNLDDGADPTLGNIWDELPDIELSIKNVVRIFEKNPRLNPPTPQIEIEQYLNDFADEITRAGQGHHQVCNCGISMPGHVFPVFLVFLIKYMELDTNIGNQNSK